MSEEIITTDIISATLDSTPSENTTEGNVVDTIPSENISEDGNIVSTIPEIIFDDGSSESDSDSDSDFGSDSDSDSDFDSNGGGGSSSGSNGASSKKPNYVRLDDDVSFQILRTNPRLTTNTKLMYDGENLYMDSYQATPLLSTLEYKHHRVWKTGLFNRDIRNFLLGTNTAAYEVGQNVSDTIVLNNFDNQFENMYWCGVESINSSVYPQEMGCIAPLYLRKKRPNYFVIFKIDNPSNTNLVGSKDLKYDFYNDVLKKMKIVKTFDLREGTPIGNYIKRYVEQRDFHYDQSIYVNFSSDEIYYYGIDKKSGVLTQKVENFKTQLLENDNTIMKQDDWITGGFERNGLIFPYIMNIEFLFDDITTEEYKFARYFGMYCNDIDLYDLNIVDGSYSKETGVTTLTTRVSGINDIIDLSDDGFYYIKDKYKNIFGVSNNILIPGYYNVPGEINVKDFKGFESSSISTFGERVEGVGNAMMILKITDKLITGDRISISLTINGTKIGEFIASNQYDAGDFHNNIFSCKGTLEDMAMSLAKSINSYNLNELQWMNAYNIGAYVILRAAYPGTNFNNFFTIDIDEVASQKVEKITDAFMGGTDFNGCMFKVYTSDKDMFFDNTGEDQDSTRYLKCGDGTKDNAEILSVMPYINENNQIDDTYSLLITDKYGQYVNISKTDQMEIVDKYYARIGMLSFFPVRDFDFDTVSSVYGDYAEMQKELDVMNIALTKGNGDSDIEDSDIEAYEMMRYRKFVDDNDNKLDTEYEYYLENIIPELSTENKTVPHIVKWGYTDEAKDSCEKPYRLNMSKIFDTSNFSANTYMQTGDMIEYTHSMPYYVTGVKDENEKVDNNEYQYITVNESLWNKDYDKLVGNWINYFTDIEENHFDEMFGDVPGNKRYNKKYSRFLFGNSVNRSSTLFRGVKFEIIEMNGNKETHTGKYNGYKFSFLYIPVSEIKEENVIYFVKNDKYKFVVGLVFFNVKKSLNDIDFNKSYVYAGAMGFLKFKDSQNIL